MNILINDHSGHPFQVQLSRALAARGHRVLHTYTEHLLTPRGALQRSDADPPGLQIQPIRLARPFSRYGLLQRPLQEYELGRRLVALVREFQPRAVISSNTPLGAQAQFLRECRSRDIDFVFWLQDLLGVGIRDALARKLPLLGVTVGRHYERLERRLLRESRQVIVITDDFIPSCRRAGVAPDAVHVIPNWAPLDEIPVTPKNNAWSVQQGLAESFNFLYSGTLGMKHNPQRLVELTQAFRADDQVRIVAITEGLGADYLAAAKRRHGLDRLILLPFQPFDRMPELLGAADVLITLLEPSAGIFAVPSKVSTNLCACRPQLLAVPPENLAARIVSKQNAGLLVPPQDGAGFVAAARRLRADAELRARLGQNGRAYAETHFDITAIAARFESILLGSRA